MTLYDPVDPTERFDSKLFKASIAQTVHRNEAGAWRVPEKTDEEVDKGMTFPKKLVHRY